MKKVCSFPDVIGIVVKNWGLVKMDGGRKRRELHLTDQTKACVRVTLWNNAADDFGEIEQLPVALRRAVVNEFQNVKCLNTYWFTLDWV